MSNQTLEQSAAQVTELNAETVKKALGEPKPREATRSYDFKIKIFEYGGTVHISWWLDSNYAVGAQDVVQLRLGSEFLGNLYVIDRGGLAGTWDTQKAFGTGFNASYWAWDYSEGHPRYCQLVMTENT